MTPTKTPSQPRQHHFRSRHTPVYRKQRRQGRVAAREKAGMTQEQAAKACGLRLSTFKVYERSNKFPPERAEVLAHKYGCSIEVFL